MEASLLMQQRGYQGRLKTFETNLTNFLDDKVNDVLVDLKNKHKEGYIALSKYNFEKLDREDVEYKMIVRNLELEFNIIALLETKIIYLWKIFEIKLKELIKVAYRVDTKEFYKFDSIINFLKEQGINLSNIKDYNNIIDLLKVNNQCKHEGLKWCDKISHIKEFSGCTESISYMPFTQAETFYNRVKDIPESYLATLKGLILEDRLSFDRKKYKEIARPLVIRMEHQEAIEFMEVFLDIYNLKPEHLTNTKNDINGVYFE